MFFDLELSVPWVAAAPPSREIVEKVMPGAQRVIEGNSLDAIGNLVTESVGVVDGVTRTSMAATPTFVPHPRIAERARVLGFGRVTVTAPTDAGLLASLLEYFASKQP